MEQFDQLNKLGEGSFGQVFKVRRKLDAKIYVLKQIDISTMNSKAKEEAAKEASLLAKLDNRYIVKYYESFVSKAKLNIIMEYCEQGDLAALIRQQCGRPFQEQQIWGLFIQMCLGLAYLHSQKILHRDFKSMNVFLASNQQVRIGDLGVAKVLSDHTNFARTFVGTPYYLSPELCEEKPYNDKSDIWALGCVLYELLTFKHPFNAQNQAALIMKIIRGTYEPVKNYSKNLTDIVDQCLQKNQNSRPSSQQLLQLACVIQQSKPLKIYLNLDQLHPTSIKVQTSQNEEEKQPQSNQLNQSPSKRLVLLQKQKIEAQEKQKVEKRTPSQHANFFSPAKIQQENPVIPRQPQEIQKKHEFRPLSVNKEEDQKKTILPQRRSSQMKPAENEKKSNQNPVKQTPKIPKPKIATIKLKKLETNGSLYEQQVIKDIIQQQVISNEEDFFSGKQEGRQNVQNHRLLLEKEKKKMDLEGRLQLKMNELEKKFGKLKYKELLAFIRQKLTVNNNIIYLFLISLNWTSMIRRRLMILSSIRTTRTLSCKILLSFNQLINLELEIAIVEEEMANLMNEIA